MHVLLNDDEYKSAIDLFRCFEYEDYDESTLSINSVIGYHDYVNVLDVEHCICDGIAYNHTLTDKFKELLAIYWKFAMAWSSDKHFENSIEYIQYKFDVLDYVLYSLRIKNINTLLINMYGKRKKELYEY